MNNSLNIWDREKYLEAWYFASIRHSGQKYGGHEPGLQIDYLTHLGKVSMEVIWALQYSTTKYDADLAIQCAILHDTLEDTSTSYEELEIKFGKMVADGVLALTKNENLPDRKDQMNDSLLRIQKQGKEIWMVKMADRISNLYKPPFYWNKQKILSYIDEADFIHSQLFEANQELAFRLKLKIAEYMKYTTA
jgi:(p)ppGpp synthase/HD superfamily hydrolase